MKHICSLLLVFCLTFSSICIVYANSDFIPREESIERGEELYSKCGFELIENEAAGEIVSIASDGNGWIYILKQLSVEEKQIDIYDGSTAYCSSIFFRTDGTCGLLQIEDEVFLYFVRGQFAFSISNGNLTSNLYSFDDPSGRMARNNYLSTSRECTSGKLTMFSGNTFLKVFGYKTKVKIDIQEGTKIICDTTEYCTNRIIATWVLIIGIGSIVFLGIVYQIRKRKVHRGRFCVLTKTQGDGSSVSDD